MTLTVFQMQRDAIHEALVRTVYGSVAQKVIAAELDMSPSELSRRVSDNESLQFPFEKIPRLMEITGDYRILDTLADLSGREVRVKEINATELVGLVVRKIEELPDQLKAAMNAVINGNQKT